MRCRGGEEYGAGGMAVMKTRGLSERGKREREHKFSSVRSGCSSSREHNC